MLIVSQLVFPKPRSWMIFLRFAEGQIRSKIKFVQKSPVIPQNTSDKKARRIEACQDFVNSILLESRRVPFGNTSAGYSCGYWIYIRTKFRESALLFTSTSDSLR
ncbi:hypothetical protein MSAN_01694400 [Mycena sanguinolenta]|uniref:Uncharacterized protein n=1 Tax=Mycena sanguinolenta TaxID=230812 RepID=A0A8H7CWA0_9AGAR|nr:hypothetical protein MSAN_01694400 [Mycena sanguinolenta]